MMVNYKCAVPSTFNPSVEKITSQWSFVSKRSELKVKKLGSWTYNIITKALQASVEKITSLSPMFLFRFIRFQAMLFSPPSRFLGDLCIPPLVTMDFIINLQPFQLYLVNN